MSSVEEDFKRDIQELKTWFRARGYPERLINQQGAKVMQKSLLDQIQSKDSGLPLIVTYNPHLSILGRSMHKHLYLLSNQDN